METLRKLYVTIQEIKLSPDYIGLDREISYKAGLIASPGASTEEKIILLSELQVLLKKQDVYLLKIKKILGKSYTEESLYKEFTKTKDCLAYLTREERCKQSDSLYLKFYKQLYGDKYDEFLNSVYKEYQKIAVPGNSINVNPSPQDTSSWKPVDRPR